MNIAATCRAKTAVIFPWYQHGSYDVLNKIEALKCHLIQQL